MIRLRRINTDNLMKRLESCKVVNSAPTVGANIDSMWKDKFDVAANAAGQPHLQALYPSSQVFERRHKFISNMIREAVVEFGTNIQNHMRCLDIGCSSGFYSAILQNYGLNVCGIDYSFKQVHEAQCVQPSLRVICGSGYSLPFRTGTFDVAVSFGLLQCVANWRLIIDESLRVVRPGGIILFETNRAFPVAERFLRGASYVAMGKMRLAGAVEFFRSYSSHPSPHLLLAGTPLKFQPKQICDYLQSCGITQITVYDPVILGLIHGFFCGFAIKTPLLPTATR